MGSMTGLPVKLDIVPGVFTEQTDSNSGARWVDCDLIRFKNSLVQSLGGWKQQNLSAALRGVPRSIHDWVALDDTKYVSVGTEKRLYIIAEDFTVNNITPIRDQGTLGADPISTSSVGSYDPSGGGNATFVNIEHTGHGVSVGDIVTLTGATAVGGITISGDYEVKSVTDVNNYIIQHSSAATSTATGGGVSVDYIYEISVGAGLSGVQSGWGTGGWGEETWDTPRTDSTYVLELRTWSLENWGEDLIASPRGGEIYVWDKTNGTGTRATEITQAPDTNLRVIVSPENRQLISLGANTGAAEDPLFIAWSDNEDYTTWVPATGNTAGDKRLDQGSEIITGLPSRAGILIFTDTGVHVMQATGGRQIYAFRQLGSGISIAGPSAVADANGVIYFMGKTNFYVYDGTLRVLPCDVWTRVFDKKKSPSAMNTIQSFSVFCSHNKDFNEVWWFYPGQGQSVNDKYVVYNYLENIWYYGDLERASFHDFSPFVDRPYGLDNAGNFYTHEDGVNSAGDAMTSYIESSDLSLTDGDELMHVSKLIPDFDRIDGSVSVSLKGRKWPQSSEFTKGPYNADGTTEEMGVRIRARFMAMRITQSGLGESFRMGSWRARMRPDGER